MVNVLVLEALMGATFEGTMVNAGGHLSQVMPATVTGCFERQSLKHWTSLVMPHVSHGHRFLGSVCNIPLGD